MTCGTEILLLNNNKNSHWCQRMIKIALLIACMYIYIYIYIYIYAYKRSIYIYTLRLSPPPSIHTGMSLIFVFPLSSIFLYICLSSHFSVCPHPSSRVCVDKIMGYSQNWRPTFSHKDYIQQSNVGKFSQKTLTCSSKSKKVKYGGVFVFKVWSVSYLRHCRAVWSHESYQTVL